MARLLYFRAQVMVATAFAVILIPVLGKVALVGAGIGILILQGVQSELDGLKKGGDKRGTH